MEFRVSYLPLAMTKLRRIEERAKELGILDRILADYKEIESRLNSDPRTFGNLSHQFQQMKMQAYVGIAIPIVVHYGVHDEAPVVIVRDVKVLSGWGMDDFD